THVAMQLGQLTATMAFNGGLEHLQALHATRRLLSDRAELTDALVATLNPHNQTSREQRVAASVEELLKQRLAALPMRELQLLGGQALSLDGAFDVWLEIVQNVECRDRAPTEPAALHPSPDDGDTLPL